MPHLSLYLSYQHIIHANHFVLAQLRSSMCEAPNNFLEQIRNPFVQCNECVCVCVTHTYVSLYVLENATHVLQCSCIVYKKTSGVSARARSYVCIAYADYGEIWLSSTADICIFPLVTAHNLHVHFQYSAVFRGIHFIDTDTE